MLESWRNMLRTLLALTLTMLLFAPLSGYAQSDTGEEPETPPETTETEEEPEC